MIGAGVIASLGSGVIAQIACLAAALSYAFAGVFGRRFKSMGVTPMQTAAGQIIASSLMLAPVMMLVDRPWILPAPREALTNRRLMAHCAFDSRVAEWTGN
jgi:drug/metabolite transporter (DMT)-like permease